MHSLILDKSLFFLSSILIFLFRSLTLNCFEKHVLFALCFVTLFTIYVKSFFLLFLKFKEVLIKRWSVRALLASGQDFLVTDKIIHHKLTERSSW